jgi:serine/threonine-protein kinase
VSERVSANGDRYAIRSPLGEGGFATVHRAWDSALDREVALKLLRPYHAADPETRRRFLDEARRIARLRHPNIAVVFDVGEMDGRPFFAMELIEGRTFAALPRPAGGFAVTRVVALLRPLASALDYLHKAGVLHRDIKASNVMLDRSGRVVLMDFGISRSLSQTALTHTGALIGTPDYMAPEQVLRRQVTPAADIYALGVLAYQLLAGRLPFVGEMTAVMYAHVHEPPPSLREFRPDLPHEVETVVYAAMAKDPAHRPPTAMQFVEALARADRAALTPVPFTSPTPAPSRPSLERMASSSAVSAPVDRRSTPGTLPPSPASRARGTMLAAIGTAVAATVLVGLVVGVVRDGAGATTSADSPPQDSTVMSTATATTTPYVPTPTPTPTPKPLLAVGERRTLDASQQVMIPVCAAADGSPRIPYALRITAIEADPSGRVLVEYTRRVPRVPGVECQLALLADYGSSSIMLETSRRDGRPFRNPSVGGGGLAATGDENLYGKERSGTWVFDRVDLNGEAISFIELRDDGSELFRIDLLSR